MEVFARLIVPRVGAVLSLFSVASHRGIDLLFKCVDVRFVFRYSLVVASDHEFLEVDLCHRLIGLDPGSFWKPGIDFGFEVAI